MLVAYPVIDVLGDDGASIIKADNMIGAFDWSLKFRWEVRTRTISFIFNTRAVR